LNPEKFWCELPHKKSFSYSYSEIDFRNQKADFDVLDLIRFTLARRRAVKIFRTLSLIVNHYRTLKKLKQIFRAFLMFFSFTALLRINNWR